MRSVGSLRCWATQSVDTRTACWPVAAAEEVWSAMETSLEGCVDAYYKEAAARLSTGQRGAGLVGVPERQEHDELGEDEAVEGEEELSDDQERQGGPDRAGRQLQAHEDAQADESQGEDAVRERERGAPGGFKAQRPADHPVRHDRRLPEHDDGAVR